MLENNSEIWDLFTKKEEYFPDKLDKHNRFTYSNSKYKNVLEPEASKFMIRDGLEVEFPDNKKFAVCLTHDIDDIYPPFKHMVLSSAYCLKNLNIKELKDQVAWNFKGKKYSPYINFDNIMELEAEYNAKSSFYFMTAENDPNRFRYDIEDLGSELGNIIDNGWEVGLHGGYYSYNSLENIIKEKMSLEKTLGQKIIGYRNHYLRFKVPDTWELLTRSGFKYDTSFGYSDMVGFRNGMCHPFKPYDLKTNKEIDILEIPLVVMDGTLFDITSSFEDAWNYVKRLIDTVEDYNGVITFLWHNHAFASSFRKEWAKLYEKILKYCYEKNAWMTSTEEIYKWWENGH